MVQQTISALHHLGKSHGLVDSRKGIGELLNKSKLSIVTKELLLVRFLGGVDFLMNA